MDSRIREGGVMTLYRGLREGRSSKGPRAGRAFRPLILLLIFSAAGWGFWSNTQHRLENLAIRGLFFDETQSVPAGQREEIQKLLGNFKKDFGMALEMRILTKMPSGGGEDASRIRMDIVPSEGRASFFFPPLVRHAVGPVFITDMERSFARDFVANDWRLSLTPAITALRNKLAEVTR